MGTSNAGSLLHRPSIWWTAVLLLLIIFGAGSLGPLSADPRMDLVLPERFIPDPAVPATPAPEPVVEPEQARDPGPELVYATIAALIVLITVAAYMVITILKRLRRPQQELGNESDAVVELDPTPGETASVIRAHLARATEVLSGPADSADAVIACWLQLEAATSHAGRSRELHETPSEYTAGILERFDAAPTDTATLMTTYERVRFAASAHRREVSPTELNAAREALNGVTTAVRTFMDRQSRHENA